jgi:hypothetical protein
VDGPVVEDDAVGHCFDLLRRAVPRSGR